MAKFITKDSKPGKGVSKNEPEKRRFFLFFEILFAKFIKLVQLNLIFTIAIIPLLIGLFFSFDFNKEVTSFNDFFNMQLFTFAPDYISLIILALSVFITGPSTAGAVFVLRNMQRREHTWVWSDFWDQFKKNYWKGVSVGALDLVIYIMLYIAFGFYMFVMPTEFTQMGTLMPNLAGGVVILVTIIYTWMHFYLYTMMVTFDLKLKPLFKNSFIFAIAKLPLNILITVIIALLVVGGLYLFVLSPVALATLLGICGLSIIGFIVVFSTYPTIDTLMLKKAEAQNKRVLKY